LHIVHAIGNGLAMVKDVGGFQDGCLPREFCVR
jgi:hypothetical protein